MLGILLLIAFELCGLAIARSLFAGCARAVRAWLGLCLGLVLMMWLPALFAFALRFTPAAQFCGLGVAALHNRFYKIQLPQVLSFFGGTRFVPIISTAVYLLVGGYLSWATGTRWSAIVYTFRYLDLGSPVHVAMAWGMVLIAALLVFATARAFRGTRLSPSRRSVVLTAAGWVIWLLATVTPLGGYVVWPLYLLLDSSWVFQLWDLLRLAALTALVCVTAALRRGRGEKA